MGPSRLLLPLCAALGATVLAGCGISHDTLSFDPVAKAATKTAESTSARVAFQASMNIEGVGAMSFAGSGVFDGRTKSAALDMNFNLPPAVQAQFGGNSTCSSSSMGATASSCTCARRSSGPWCRRRPG